MRFLPLTISEMKNLESEERIMSEKHQNESEAKDLGGQLQCILRSLVGAARKNRGMITRDQLEQALKELQLSGEQEKLVEEYLKQNNIGIDEPLDAEEKLSEEEADYLREYTEMVNAMEQPSDGEREAIEIQAMAGEKDAQRQLAEWMLPKVVDLARLYAGQGVFMEDLIGAGNEALVRGTKLLAPLEGPEEVEGALAERIMNAMEDLVAENLDEVSADQTAADTANKVLEKADELAKILGRKVSVEELAGEGEVTEEEILDAIRITGNRIESLEDSEAADAGKGN